MAMPTKTPPTPAQLQRRALDALDAAGTPLTIDGLMAALHAGRDAARATLLALIRTGEVAEVTLSPAGRPGKRLRGYRAVEDPAPPRAGKGGAS